MTNFDLTFGETILILRRRKGWTGNEVSAMAGISTTHWSKLEQGEKFPRASTLRKIAEVLEYPLEELAVLFAREAK